MQIKYLGNPNCKGLQASQSLGQVTSVKRAVVLLVQVLFFLYTPKNPEQSHRRFSDTWSFFSQAAFENVVHCGGSCHVCLFICFYSHLLLDAHEPGTFSGAGLLLCNVAPKSVQKDLDKSVAGITFDPWIPF